MTANFSANPLASLLSADQTGLSNSASSLTTTPATAGTGRGGADSEVSFSSILQGYTPTTLPDNAIPAATLPNLLTSSTAATELIFDSEGIDSIMSTDLSGLTGPTPPPSGNNLPVDLTEVASFQNTDLESPIDPNIIQENLPADALDVVSVDFTQPITNNSAAAAMTHATAVPLPGAPREPAQAVLSKAKVIKMQGNTPAPNPLTLATADERLAQVQTQLAATRPVNSLPPQLQSELPPPPAAALQNMLKQQMTNSARPSASALPGIGGLAGVDSAAGDEAFLLQPAQGSVAAASVDKPAALQSTPVLPTIPRAVGTPDWNQGLGQRMMLMVENGLNQAELRLDPPQLGSIHVRIAMSDDQAQLFFQAAHPAARDALESALPRLREMFAEQGLQLDNADIGGESQQSASDLPESESELQDTVTIADGQESSGDVLDGPLGKSISTVTHGLIDEFV